MISRIVVLFLLLLGLAACEKPLAEPEKVDPIYSDLEAQLKAAQTIHATELKALEDARKHLESLGPRDMGRKRTQFEVFEREKKVRRLAERELYHQLLIDKRLEYVRKVYPKKYEAKEPWPDPAEVDQYKTNKRLKSASRNWADRVPKLKDRISAVQKAEKVEKAAEKPTE